MALGRPALAITLALALAGCMVGPDYQKPAAIVPAGFKEAAGWRPAIPQDAADRGRWWAIYHDPVLDQLEAQVAVSNQSLKASEAAFRQARALVGESGASLFPTLAVTPSATRSGGGRTKPRTSYELSGDASWVIDLWGRIRRQVEGDLASAQASAGDLASARLSAQAALASDYFQLRGRDAQLDLLNAAVEAYKQSLAIATNQYQAGIVSRADVVTAQTQLDTTQSQAVAVGVQRAQLEHAIAVLIGKPPAELTIAKAPLATTVPVVPAGLPSTLLERRPDIAAAERRMAVANAQVGVATAAFFPTLTLSASGGFSGSALGTLLRASDSLWSLGGSLAQTVFDGGLRRSELAAARATYDEAVATYRQTALTGFQQVEDQLASLRILEEQAGLQDRAVASAREAERLQLNQYRAGTAAYTAVITAQQTALGNEETAVTILQDRLVASVGLVQALGGGWNASALPNQVDLDDPLAFVGGSAPKP